MSAGSSNAGRRQDVRVTDEWEVRLTLAVQPPPDEATVMRMGTAESQHWSGVGLAEGSQGITRLALDYTSAVTTAQAAVADAFVALGRGADRRGTHAQAGDRGVDNFCNA